MCARQETRLVPGFKLIRISGELSRDMVRSMTGFGRAEITGQSYRVTCEVKGVNHRFLDLYLRVSRKYAVLEDRVRELVKKYVARGRIEMSLNIERIEESERSLKVDKALAMAYYKSLIELAEYLNISSNFSVIELMRLPEVFSLEDGEEDLEVLWQDVAPVVEEALRSLTAMRENEGQNLREDILKRNEQIRHTVQVIEGRSTVIPKEYAEKIRKRLSELVPEVNIEESRIVQEIALLADKASIAEEVVRLNSHIRQLASLFEAGGPVGRKCDFLVQEMFREINTIGSKANDITVSQLVVEVKAELEKMREQLQNIE